MHISQLCGVKRFWRENKICLSSKKKNGKKKAKKKAKKTMSGEKRWERRKVKREKRIK